MATRRRRWYRRYPIIPMAIIGIIVVLALFPSQLAPHDPAAQSLVTRLRPPFWQSGGSTAHWLGTDHLGRDVLSRLDPPLNLQGMGPTAIRQHLRVARARLTT